MTEKSSDNKKHQGYNILRYQRWFDALKPWNGVTLLSLFLLLSPTVACAADLKDVLSGYYKMLTAFTKATSSSENIFYAMQRLRLEFEPKLTKNIELNLTYDHELILNDFSNTPNFNLIRQKNQKNFAARVRS